MSENTAKLITISADTPEELALEFAKAISAVGDVSVQPSKGGKPYGKWVSVGGGIGGFQPSIALDATDDVRIEGKQPMSVNVTVVFSNLQAPSAMKKVRESEAATILADIARLQAKARRLGVEVPSAGEEGE